MSPLTLIVLALVATQSSLSTESCPRLEVTDRVWGIEKIYTKCLVEAQEGDARAQWSVSLMTRYMACENTDTARHMADAWESLAVKARVPEAIVDGALSAYHDLGDVREHIGEVRRIVDDVATAADLGSADAEYLLYSFQKDFDWVIPPIRQLGGRVDAIRHLVRAADSGSYMASDKLADIYLWAARTNRGLKAGRGSVVDEEFQRVAFGALIDTLDHAGLLQRDFASAAEKYLLQSARLDRWDSAKKLAEAYERGDFGAPSPSKASAWRILYRVAMGADPTKPSIPVQQQNAVCEALGDITRDRAMFRFWRPELPDSDTFPLGKCIHLRDLQFEPTCLPSSALQAPKEQ